MIFGSKSDVQKIEADIARLAKRRAELVARLSAAERAEKAARNDLLEHLISGAEDDAAVVTRREAAVQAAEREVAALNDALAEITFRETGHRRRLDEAIEVERLEIEATKREHIASAAEKFASRLSRAVDEIKAVAEGLESVVTQDVIETRHYTDVIGHGATVTPNELVGATIAEALYERLPHYFTHNVDLRFGKASMALQVLRRMNDLSLNPAVPVNDDSVRFLDALGAISENIVTPLRQRADELRAGPSAAPPLVEPPPFEIVDIVLTKKAQWVDETGETRIADAWSAKVPKPVAEKAFALKVAVRPGTREAREQFERASRAPRVDPRAMAQMPAAEIIDLGVNVKALLDAERARLNSTSMAGA